MNKPLSLILQDTKTNIITSCNQSGLPLVILDMIVQDIAKDIHMAALQQAEQEKAAYAATIEAEVEAEKVVAEE